MSVIRYNIRSGLFSLLQQLSLCLEHRKVKLSQKSLVHPRRTFLIVIIELRASWHNEYKKQEEPYQRQIRPESARYIDFSHNYLL